MLPTEQKELKLESLRESQLNDAPPEAVRPTFHPDYAFGMYGEVTVHQDNKTNVQPGATASTSSANPSLDQSRSSAVPPGPAVYGPYPTNAFGTYNNIRGDQFNITINYPAREDIHNLVDGLHLQNEAKDKISQSPWLDGDVGIFAIQPQCIWLSHPLVSQVPSL